MISSNLTKLIFAILVITLSTQLAAASLRSSLKLFDIYESNLQKALSTSNKTKQQLIFDRLSLYHIKLKSYETDKTLTDADAAAIADRIDLYEELERKLTQASPKNKSQATIFQSALDYNSSQGSIYGLGVDWDPAFVRHLDWHNKSKIELADGRLNSLSYSVNNRFTWEKQPFIFDIKGFSHPGNSGLSNIEFHVGKTHEQDIMEIEKARIQSLLHLRFQNNANNLQLNLRGNKNIEGRSINGGYTGNLNEIAGNIYHQGHFSLQDTHPDTVIGFQWNYHVGSRLTLTPNDGQNHVLYSSFRNTFKKAGQRLRANVLLNYGPNNPFQTTLFFKNNYTHRLNNTMFNAFGLNLDIKNAKNRTAEYTRIGGELTMDGGTHNFRHLRHSFSLDNLAFEVQSNSYTRLSWQTLWTNSHPSANFTLLTTRVARRIYPNNSQSAWQIDASDISPWTINKDLHVDRSLSANLVKFDNASTSRSDSLSLLAGLRKSAILVDGITLTTALSGSTQFYLQNSSANKLSVQLSVEAKWK